MIGEVINTGSPTWCTVVNIGICNKPTRSLSKTNTRLLLHMYVQVCVYCVCICVCVYCVCIYMCVCVCVCVCLHLTTLNFLSTSLPAKKTFGRKLGVTGASFRNVLWHAPLGMQPNPTVTCGRKGMFDHLWAYLQPTHTPIVVHG